MNKRILKNGAVGGYIKNKNGKKVWRILKGPKKGGSCKYSLCKTFFFNNICTNDPIYYPSISDVKTALLRFMNKKNIIIKTDNTDDCICEGIKEHYKNEQNKNVKIQLLGNKKGVSGTPYKVNFNNTTYITKQTKIDTKSLTKKGKPIIRHYGGLNNIKLKPNNNKFYLYFLSNYETQTLNGLNIMYASNNNISIRKNILQTYDAFICNDYGYNLLEIANSGTLQDLLKKPINLNQFANLFVQIFETLYHLQDTIDFCHNDFKGSNIFMSNGNIIKIADLDRSSSTFKYKDKYYRIINRKDLCFGTKDFVYNIYKFKDYYYFKVGMYLDATCRLRHTINNISFAKVVDLYVGLLNFIQNDFTRNYIFEKHESIIKKLFCELSITGKIKSLSDKKWGKFKKELYSKLSYYESFNDFYKILNYKNIVITVNIRQIINPILLELKNILTTNVST